MLIFSIFDLAYFTESADFADCADFADSADSTIFADSADSVNSPSYQPLQHLLIIVGKKWESGNLVPSRSSGQIRKVEARLGKLEKIRKVEAN